MKNEKKKIVRMRFTIYFLLIIFAIVIIIGYKKQNRRLVDDTWYILDEYAILMLCERPDQDSFKELMVMLKGNGDSLNETIDILREMEQDPAVKNALGVAYLRLRNFKEAEKELLEALNTAESDKDKVCILTNLAEVMLFKYDTVSAENYIEEALKLGEDDSLKNLVLESNLISMSLSNKTRPIEEIVKIKELLKKERKLLGTNQFVGIFNYETLAYACYYQNNINRCEYYIKKAVALNKKTNQYDYVDAYLYKRMALMFEEFKDGTDKAIDYISKAIDILDDWQNPDHYDILASYEIRGTFYTNMILPDRDLAIKDFQYVLDHCSPYHELAAASYYNLAKTYIYYENKSLIIDSYAKAYYLWQLEGWLDLNQDIESELREEYTRQNVENKSYDVWFKQKIEKARHDLEIQWGSN